MRIPLILSWLFAGSAMPLQADLVERRLPEQKGHVAGLAFSPDGKFLATVTDGLAVRGELRVWNVATGEERPIKFDHPSNLGISSVAWSPDGEWIATGYWNQVKLDSVGFIALLHVRTGNLINEWKAHDGATYSVAFSIDSKLIASGGVDGQVRLWDTNTNKERRALKLSGDRVHAVSFSRNGKHLAAIAGDGTLSVWDSEGKRLRFSTNRHEQFASGSGKPVCRALAFSSDGAQLATGDSLGNILVWDVATGRPGEHITVRAAEVIHELAFRPNEHLLAAAVGTTVRLFDPDTHFELSRFESYSERVYSLAFSPDGSLLAAGDRLRGRISSMNRKVEKSPANTSLPEIGPTEQKTTVETNAIESGHDKGPWVIAAAAAILVFVLAAVAKICSRPQRATPA